MDEMLDGVATPIPKVLYMLDGELGSYEVTVPAEKAEEKEESILDRGLSSDLLLRSNPWSKDPTSMMWRLELTYLKLSRNVSISASTRWGLACTHIPGMVLVILSKGLLWTGVVLHSR